MLWLALHFPQFALDVLNRGRTDDAACVVIARQRVIQSNAAAQAAGVSEGMGQQAAIALLPHLQLLMADTDAERQALEQLAAWSLQFTAQVSLQPPNGLLLEIGGSLRLFGGLPRLRQRITGELIELGYQACNGIAPTANGAWLLAKARDGRPVIDRATLRQRIGVLPWGLLPLTIDQQQALQGLGLQTLEDCLALPRGGLGRRLGKSLLLELERALGERPEPRPMFQPPQRYEGRLELPAEAHDNTAILFALQRLLRELCGQLRGMECGVQTISLRLEHARAGVTTLQIGFLQQTRDVQRLLRVCRERLERQALPAPVTALELVTTDIRPLPPEAMDLLVEQDTRPTGDWRQLAERLSARLGERTVTGLGTRADHRPEKAWSTPTAGEQVQQYADPYRPLWLLRTPELLEQHRGRPCWNGPLTLRVGPERLESGWWDGQDITRDYYTALAPNGSLLWIYRERRAPGGWFLHGFFA
ncbi:protein ImuB [Natronocella acetinitrilica]|uniref:Protein ImuB n=1 Tax=Natronocella acetinitrilica TaxID=414046 RepID=A0AAE3G5D2_9GAMM|nr:DNA polymerase Y family protein [Natronocella acetinitrilica]MCP1674713.1 protein ImuB [Natronocella acetinitrilica]